jgi:acyl-homoserine-lactone acylase
MRVCIYGESRGRAAEYFGPTGLANGKWVWTNSVPQRSADMLAKQTPEFRGYLEAFAKGINDYAAQNPNALSEQAKRVLPVTSLDPVEHAHRIVHFTYLGSPRLAGNGPVVTAASLLETPEAVGSDGWGDCSFTYCEWEIHVARKSTSVMG